MLLQNSLEKMNFSKVVSCHKQVVSGLMYHFVIEVEEGSQLKQYEAKVWVKPGGSSRKLEEFKSVDGGLTSADTGVKTEGWCDVSLPFSLIFIHCSFLVAISWVVSNNVVDYLPPSHRESSGWHMICQPHWWLRIRFSEVME